MAKSHLKRFITPKTWKIKKKGITFVARPNPGAHSMELSMPMSVIMKAMLKHAKTTAEVKKMLRINEVLVDGRRVIDHRFPAGFMDVLTIKSSNENYRIVLDSKGKIAVISIDPKEAGMKISRIKGKTAIKGGKIQLNLSDSRNITVENGKDYKLGESLLIEVPSQKIAGHLKLEKGAYILLVAGKHIADSGVIEKVGKYVVIYKNEKGEAKTTSKKYAFVVGKEKPSIKIK